MPVALPDEPWRTAQCAPHPPPAVTSPPCIPQSRPGAGVPPRTPTSVVRVCTMPPLIWRYCKMFFTESAARGLIDVIDVIDHAWRPIDTPATHAGPQQLDSRVGTGTYIPRTASRPCRLTEGIERAQRAWEFSAAAEAIFGWGCKWMLILLRLRGDSQPEPEFSGFFVHIFEYIHVHSYEYLVQPKTRADPRIELLRPPRCRGRRHAQPVIICY